MIVFLVTLVVWEKDVSVPLRKDSEYTIMITVMHWPKACKIVLKLTRWWSYVNLVHGCHCSLLLLLAVQPLGKAHKDYDYAVVIAIMHWHFQMIISPW